ncbi:tRNA(Ile)-lysidine synthase [bacterium BMS3Bbin09]|nr:tRNA(Ile)-lysidine synthase [bacterium BMS3Bbin09]HDH34845.1 tRNA lysidine(34) synthetase TilS [Nitrospirota bacterium]
MELIERVSSTIKKFNMFPGGGRVLIGLSGGPDSVCLTIILDKLKGDLDISLSAVYIDHGLRPEETGKEAEFCRSFCKERGINFIEESVNVKEHAEEGGINLQEAARELRYQKLEEISARTGTEYIALGHNADDQAETVLMRLFKGAGMKGLTGIPPVRDRIIRPLIETERKDIEEFLLRNVRAYCNTPLQPPYMVDSSNLKEKYYRNWLRLSLMSEIRKKDPAVVREIARTAEILRDEDEYLEIIVTKTLMRLFSRKSDGTIELFLTPLEGIEKPILRRLLRRAVDAAKGLRGISFTNIEDIIDLIRNGKAGDSIDLPKEIRVIKEYSILKISTLKHIKIAKYKLEPPCDILIRETGAVIQAVYEERGANLPDKKEEVLLDSELLKFPLKVRPRVAGDHFYPAGFGKKKKLQDFFVDEKVPRDMRDSVPLVLSGDDIVWVAGFRADERFTATDKTEKVLRLIITKQ